MAVSCDETNRVPCAGLLPAGVLAQRVGLAGLVDQRLTLARAGALPVLFDETRAPSTSGTWLRSFRRHNVRQLDAVSRELLVGGDQVQRGIGAVERGDGRGADGRGLDLYQDVSFLSSGWVDAGCRRITMMVTSSGASWVRA